MRSGTLLDTGPLVAYFSRREAHHDWAVAAFNRLEPPAITCEPVLTEVCFLIARGGSSAARVLDQVRHRQIEIGFPLDREIEPVRALIERYADVPMSLADACLVRLAEMTGLPICTLDRDFSIYRAHGRAPLTLITPYPDHRLHEP